MKIQVEHVTIDVQRGRKLLEKELRRGKIPITITGFIEYPSSRDDGTSVEFYVRPTKITHGSV